MELSENIKKSIEFIGLAAIGGIIGNRADSWFVNLYYHEKKRILQWASSLTISQSEQEEINNNEKLKVLFSQVTHSVANEIFDQKLLIWPTITESLLRNTKFEFDKKLYFINIFIKLEPFAIHFLATLFIKGEIPYGEIYPLDDRPNLDNKNYGFYLGHLQAETFGLTDSVGIKITDLGYEFIDFISNSLIEKISQFAEQ